MKSKIATLAVAAILAGCATAPFVIGSALQIGTCELAQARPASKAPLLAAGLTFQAYASLETPTVAQLSEAFANLPPLAGADANEVRAFVNLVLAGYGPLYASIQTDADKERLRLWFGQVGLAFINGSQCKPTVQPARVGAKPSIPPNWFKLADEVRASMKQVKK